jgi:hypothetical protein
LPELLASLSAQTHLNWRLWISDDGSDDETVAILTRFQRQNARREVRLSSGPGQGCAANFLSLLCHPDLPSGPVALCDQDDVWLKGKLARALRRIAASDTTGPVIYAAESFLTTDRLVPYARSSALGSVAGFGNALVQNLCSGHTTVLNAAAVNLVRRAGPLPGIRFHDWWLYQLVTGAGGTCLLDPTPVALYRQHDCNAVGASSGVLPRLRRARAILSGDYAGWLAAQHAALLHAGHLLAPEARALLGCLARDTPHSGMARATGLRRLGIRRAALGGTLALWGASVFGLA